LIEVRIYVEKKKFNTIVEKRKTIDVSMIQDVFMKGKTQTR